MRKTAKKWHIVRLFGNISDEAFIRSNGINFVRAKLISRKDTIFYHEFYQGCTFEGYH
jgi:hypothetical protein